MENLNILPETSEKNNVILVKLIQAKTEMGGVVKKDSANPFHKSRYASLGAHLELSESILTSHGLLMLHTVNLINNQSMLIATLHHPESGQWIKSYLPLPNPKMDSQGVGASLTYMRRYAIGSLLGLTAEDDDAESASVREKKNAPPKNNQPPVQENVAAIQFINEKESLAIINIMNTLDVENQKSFFEWINKAFNAPTIFQIPKNAYEKCITTLNAKIKYLNDKNKAVA